MRLFQRAPRPMPAPATTPAAAAVAEGLRQFAADLEAGDAYALDCLEAEGEMPFTPEEWAAYPTASPDRVS